MINSCNFSANKKKKCLEHFLLNIKLHIVPESKFHLISHKISEFKAKVTELISIE